MSEYLFGVRTSWGRTPGRERDRRESIANRHGCTWTEIMEPGGTYKSWFAKHNEGRPFDQQVEDAVTKEVSDELQNR